VVFLDHVGKLVRLVFKTKYFGPFNASVPVIITAEKDLGQTKIKLEVMLGFFQIGNYLYQVNSVERCEFMGENEFKAEAVKLDLTTRKVSHERWPIKEIIWNPKDLQAETSAKGGGSS
jgi:hypothetical protein